MSSIFCRWVQVACPGQYTTYGVRFSSNLGLWRWRPVSQRAVRPVLALEWLTLIEPEGMVGYRWGRDGAGQETEVMDYLEFIARVTSHIPDKGQVMVRYYGLYANAHRGMIKKASLGSFPIRMVEEELQPIPSKGWAEMIRKVYEVDPMLCPNSEASSRTAKRCPKCGSFAVLIVCMSAVE